MSEMPIKILTEDDYRGSAPGAVVTDGRLAHTHIALLNLEEDGEPQPCYVKFYPDTLGNGQVHRGLVNEIVGHVIAHQLKASVPDAAGLIVIPSSHLASCPEWVPKQGLKTMVGWWSRDMSYPSLKAHYNISDRSVNQSPALADALDELANSKEVHETIALDNLLANTDRNIGNLLRKARGCYVLIDHGCCLTGEQWYIQTLDPDQRYTNKVKQALQPKSDRLPFNAATLKAHDAMVEHLDDALEMLMPWLKMAIDDKEADAVHRFILERGSPGHFANQIGWMV